MTTKRQRKFTILIIALVLGLGVFLTWYKTSLPRRFAPLEPNVLYRSGQGKFNQFQNAIDRYHIKTIICLRETKKEKNIDWYEAEKKIAEKNKLENRNAHASTNEKEFQAYNASKINDRIQRAVENTRGKVLIYQGNYIRAWFHAYSGGKTATAEEGLDFTQAPTPYIQPVDDSGFDAWIPEEVRTWTASFRLNQIRNAVKEATAQDPGPVTQISIIQRSPSGRANILRVNNIEVKGNAFRLALDSTVLKSTLLSEIKISDGKAIFKGKGYGHGVGMSQWGARVMAEQGKTPDQIALNYFRNCQIVKLW